MMRSNRFHLSALLAAFALLLAAPQALANPDAASGIAAGDCPVPADGALGALGGDLDAAASAAGLTRAPDGYLRSTTTEVEPATVVDAAARGTLLDVPFRVQEGPTCGLYALGMVMDYWHHRDPRNPTAYVRDADARRRDAATLAPTTEEDLFPVARENGYFAESLRIVGEEGGMFVADELGRLAADFGYDYDLVEDATADDLVAAIDRGHPALVGFDVNHQGNPTTVAGDRAHWAVVTGHFQYQGETWFVAQHGWEAKRYYWRAADLEASMAQIQPTLGPKIVEVLPPTIH